MVANNISPLISLCKFILIKPLNLGIINSLFSNLTNCGILNDCLSYLLLNLGNLVCFLKNLP